LRKLVKESCAKVNYPHFKSDPATWGVTKDDDPRFTAAEFGAYKTPDRKATEKKLCKYTREPSTPRAKSLADFTIVVTVAAPGTGKTRLVDDALRMPLDAKPNEETHFDHFLRLAVTFNGNYGGTYAHPLTARMLLVFFCGTVRCASVALFSTASTRNSRNCLRTRKWTPKIRRARMCSTRWRRCIVSSAAACSSAAELCC
jgi:hypothetical protein